MYFLSSTQVAGGYIANKIYGFCSELVGQMECVVYINEFFHLLATITNIIIIIIYIFNVIYYIM